MRYFLLNFLAVLFLAGCLADMPKPKEAPTQEPVAQEDRPEKTDTDEPEIHDKVIQEFRNIRPHNVIKTSVEKAYKQNSETSTSSSLHDRKTLHKQDISDILNQNYILAELFIASADSASTINNLGNAVLLTTAVAIAGAQAETVVRTNRLLAGLFFSEGLRFVSPRKAGDAFRKAASEALCFNKKTYTSASFMKDGVFNEDLLGKANLRHRAELLYAMQVSHGNLRIRLVRPQANLVSLVTNFNDKKSEVQEASIELSNELNVAEAEAAIKKEESLIKDLKGAAASDAKEKRTTAQNKVKYLTYRKELLECLK